MEALRRVLCWNIHVAINEIGLVATDTDVNLCLFPTLAFTFQYFHHHDRLYMYIYIRTYSIFISFTFCLSQRHYYRVFNSRFNSD